MHRNLEESYAKGLIKPSTSNNVFANDQRTVVDCLRHWSTIKPEEDAVVFRSVSEPRLAISWKELYERSCIMAKVFGKLGIKHGEVIAVVSRKCPEWLYVVFGAMAAGIIVTTIVFTYADGSDVIAMMEKLRTCSLLVLDPGLNSSNWSILEGLLDDYDNQGRVTSTKMPYLRQLIFTRLPAVEYKMPTVSSLLMEKHPSEIPDVEPDNVAILFQTSGSTGVPKLVAHSQSELLNYRKSFGELDFGPVEFNDRPFGWVGGFPLCLLRGRTRVTVSGTSPPPADQLAFMMDVIQTERCTHTIMLPPQIYQLTRQSKNLPADWPMLTIATGGQPITKSLTACIGKVCKRLLITYGSTELFPMTQMMVENAEEFVDYSSGVPVEGVELKIVNREAKIVPVGESGEIYARSDRLFLEYFNDPEKTSAVKSVDGWYKTDDYGRMNADGYLFVEGRVSDMIISGGMNVTPAILESVLKDHPGVDSAVMVPVPHKELHQVVCACVKTRSGYDFTETELQEFMERKHNDKKGLFTVLPTYYLILDQIPVESTGKVSRKALRNMAEEKFGEK